MFSIINLLLDLGISIYFFVKEIFCTHDFKVIAKGENYKIEECSKCYKCKHNIFKLPTLDV